MIIVLGFALLFCITIIAGAVKIALDKIEELERRKRDGR